MTCPHTSDSAEHRAERSNASAHEAAPVSAWAVLRAGVMIGWVGGILVGLAEAALVLANAGRYFAIGDLPPGMWPGEIGRIVLTHALLWTLVLLVLSIPYACAFRWRSNRRRGSTGLVFLAASWMLATSLVIPATQLWVLNRYRPWMLLPLIAVALGASVAVYLLGRRVERRVGFLRLRRILARLTAVGVMVVAASGVFMFRSPAVGAGRYRLPPPKRNHTFARHDRPNILWVVWDTARADRLSLYGYPKPTTPFLERLAGESVVYRRAIANGVWTVPSHASMFTGLSVTEHGADHRNMYLEGSNLTIAELLRDHGYSTVLFANNPHLAAWSNFAQGFEHTPPVFQMQKLEFMSPAVWMQHTGLMPPAPWFDADAGAARTNALITHWIDHKLDPDRPWFIFVNLVDVHLPTLVPKRYREMFLQPAEVRRSYFLRRRAYGFVGTMFAYLYNMIGPDAVRSSDVEILRGQYDAALRHLDDRLAELVEALRQRGLLDSTYLILTSDHGTEQGEHELWGHVFSVYNTLAWVPLLIRYPGGSKSANIPTPVQLSDLFATVAGWAGVPPEELPPTCTPPLPERVEPSALDRIAVSEWLVSPRAALQWARKRDPDYDLTPFQRKFRAVVQGRYKYIWSSAGDDELYDLQRDPGEQSNVMATAREAGARLKELLEAWVAAEHAYQPPAETQPAEVPADVADQLRALGYMR